MWPWVDWAAWHLPGRPVLSAVQVGRLVRLSPLTGQVVMEGEIGVRGKVRKRRRGMEGVEQGSSPRDH